MSTALYRRYRPDSFETLIGQDHVTLPLRAALKAGKVTHAYLFSGPRGCGKTTSARIFARCLNCAQGPTDTPCGTCDSCVELATGGPGSLDVVEIDAASHGGVDDARELRERATFAPVRDRFKIFIIDEAHMVSSQGFNALLKLVEEPPEHVKFVFATTEPDKVLGTIRSRTHHYPFRLVPPDVLEPYLGHLATEEHIDIAPGVLNLVIRAGGGSVRDTLSVLDQLMAGAVDGALPYAQAVALLGYTDVALLDESVDALAGGDGAAIYRVVERMVDAGHDPRRFVEDLLQRLRDLLIISVAGEGAGDVLTNVPADQMERMITQARNWGPRALSRAADLTDRSLRSMVGATSPRLQLELLIGRILIPEPQPAATLAGSVGLAGGGAPHEAAAPHHEAPPAGGQGRFGAAEAREQLRRQRAAQSGGAPEEQEATPAAGPGAVSGAGPVGGAAQPAASPAPAAPVAPLGEWGAPSASWDTPAQPVAPQVSEAPAQPALASAAPAAPAPGVQAAPAQPEAPAAAPQGGQPAGVSSSDADMLRQRWSEVIERLSSISRVAWTMLRENAQLGGVEGRVAVIVLPTQGMVDNFVRGNRAPDVERAIYEATGLQLSVNAQVGQARGGAAVTTPSASTWQAAPPQSSPTPPAPWGEGAPAQGMTQGQVSTEDPFRSESRKPRPVAQGQVVQEHPSAPAADTAHTPSHAQQHTAQHSTQESVQASGQEHAPAPVDAEVPVADASPVESAWAQYDAQSTPTQVEDSHQAEAPAPQPAEPTPPAPAAPSDKPSNESTAASSHGVFGGGIYDAAPQWDTPPAQCGAPAQHSADVESVDTPAEPAGSAGLSAPAEPATPVSEDSTQGWPPITAPAWNDPAQTSWGPVAPIPGAEASPVAVPEADNTAPHAYPTHPLQALTWGDAPATKVTFSVIDGGAPESDTSAGDSSEEETEAPTPEETHYVAAADDDSASIDDDDIEVNTIVGLEAVQQILGAKVIEEKTDESAW